MWIESNRKIQNQAPIVIENYTSENGQTKRSLYFTTKFSNDNLKSIAWLNYRVAVHFSLSNQNFTEFSIYLPENHIKLDEWNQCDRPTRLVCLCFIGIKYRTKTKTKPNQTKTKPNEPTQ